MNKEMVAEYLSSLKKKTGLTYSEIATKSERSESTVKNLILGNIDDPRVDSVAPVVYALGGSMDEMLNPNKSKDESKETSAIALKDLTENFKKVEDQYEKRLTDKIEIIQILKKENLASKIVAWSLGSILILLLIIEVMHPNLGWIRY